MFNVNKTSKTMNNMIKNRQLQVFVENESLNIDCG